jgi:phosphoribosylformylglycinamidine synthase
MSFGYNPEIGPWSPYHGGMFSVIDSIAKLVTVGGNYKKARISMQEYFEKLGEDSEKWGKPFIGLLGAFKALNEFSLAAIGGKDSMSGTFKDINVPPTVISFALAPTDVRDVISPELKLKDSCIMRFECKRNSEDIPNYSELKTGYDKIYDGIKDKKIISAYTVGSGGIAGSISKMAFGNKIGVEIYKNLSLKELLEESHGSIIFEIPKKLKEEFENNGFDFIGYTNESDFISYGEDKISINKAIESWEKTLSQIFPIKKDILDSAENVQFIGEKVKSANIKIARPKVFIPAFPGTNCEYDTKKVFEDAGADVEIVVLNNLSSNGIMESIDKMAKVIEKSQIIALPGGFSAGDEPDGSGKFIASVFRNPKMTEAVMEFIKNRDGLMIGICNGFQALIKLGLLPYGEIKELKSDSPTLTFNKIGRHVSKVARIKISSNLSPWLSLTDMESVYNTPLSHGEGRFIFTEEEFKILKENGQIATQYVDYNGNPTYDGEFNPNGSFNSVEGITSADGRIFGKMGHNERHGNNVMKNIPGRFDIRIFEAGVKYFK